MQAAVQAGDDDVLSPSLHRPVPETVLVQSASSASKGGDAEAGGPTLLRVSPGTEWDFSSFLSSGSYADLYFKESCPVIVPDPSLPDGVSSSGEEPLVPGVFLDMFLNASAAAQEVVLWPNLPLSEFFLHLHAELFAASVCMLCFSMLGRHLLHCPYHVHDLCPLKMGHE